VPLQPGLAVLHPCRRPVRLTAMWVSAFLAPLGAALGVAVAFVWRIGAAADLCTMPPGTITPMCEQAGPSALAVVGCALIGALVTGGVAMWVMRRAEGS
jgi:hypothetical protein